MKPSKSRLALAIMAVSSAAFAQDKTEITDTDTKSTTLDQVVVSATRTEQTLDSVAASVSVITADDAEKELANNIRDLVKYEPGVTVGSDSRFGLSGFNIRGMEGNRVKITVDGVDQAKSYGYEKSLQSQRNFFDIESMKQLEIVKGPASTLHGSDAIGGVVAFVTKDPSDYLNATGDDSYASAKAGYASADNSFNETLTFANRTGDWESLLVYTRRDGKERESYGGQGGEGATREKADSMSYFSDSVLGKLQYQVNDSNRIGFTGEWQKSRSSSDLESLEGYSVLDGGVYRRTYTNQSSKDLGERKRVGFFHELDANTVFFDDMRWSLNWQESETNQKTVEHFHGCVSPAGFCVPGTESNENRLKDYSYSEISYQFDSTFNKFYSVGGVENYLTYGINAEDKVLENHNETLNLDTGAVTVENWMPKVNQRQYGVFAQNEISLMDDQLTVTPGIRYDRFEENIDSHANYSGPDIEDQTYDSWTAKLGGVYRFNDTWSVFAQYNQGFATPDMFAKYFTYNSHAIVLANPDLKPEESDAFEVGVRADNYLGSMELTAFYNKYKNFIEEACVAGGNCTEDSGTFQYQNLSDATIKGVEFKGHLWLDEAVNAPIGTYLNTSIAWAQGRGTKEDENGVRQTNEPLNSVAPLTAVLGLGYDAPSEKWGSQAAWTLVADKDKDDISNIGDVSSSGSGGDAFATPGYGIVDLTAYYKPAKGVTLNAGIFNLTDKKYWVWDDVRKVTDADQGVGRYTQPGRNYSVSVKWEI